MNFEFNEFKMKILLNHGNKDKNLLNICLTLAHDFHVFFELSVK